MAEWVWKDQRDGRPNAHLAFGSHMTTMSLDQVLDDGQP